MTLTATAKWDGLSSTVTETFASWSDLQDWMDDCQPDTLTVWENGVLQGTQDGLYETR